MPRTISEILIEADANNDNLDKIEELRIEIKDNLYSYPLVQLRFAHEYLKNIVSEMARRDAKQLKESLWFLF